MPQAKDDIICRGCWSLGDNCERCSKCRETEAAYLRTQMADACEKAGRFAHWAQSEIRRLEAELTEQKALVASLQDLLEKAIHRIAAQSELLSKRAETKRSVLPEIIDPEPHMEGKDVVEQWGSLPLEPCRFCRETGGVLFLLDEGPPGRESPVIVRCGKCGRHWEADSRYA